jgi:poly(U)-specific endoribonuclease
LSKAQRQRLKREREAAEQKAHENENQHQNQQKQQQHQKQQQNNKGKGKEQEKKKQVRTAPNKDELANVAKAAEHLWTLDINRLVPNKHYGINLQSGKKVYQSHDAAADPLFKFLNKDLFFSMPTYKAFYYLLDNYERSTGEKEIVTDQEHKENWTFLDAICDTPCMQYVHNYLVSKNKSERSPEAFKKQLYGLWFELYRREGYDDSSGFEHVFVGEEKDGKVIGFHNWIQFFIEEMKGTVDYKGYILPRRMHRNTQLPDGDEHIISLQFSWEAELKNVSTSFIGVSPEFEVALYTLMFLASGERTEVTLDDFRVAIRCYHIKTRKGVRIGTSFPELLDQ